MIRLNRFLASEQPCSESKRADRRISNVEGMIIIDFNNRKDRATRGALVAQAPDAAGAPALHERYHPSTFNIRNSTVLRFAFK